MPPVVAEYGDIAFSTELTVDAAIVGEVQSQALAVARGQLTLDAPDEHANLLRLKTAGVFAVLDNRRAVTLDDWALARTFMRTSNAVRSTVIAQVAIARRKTEQIYIARHVAREGAVFDDHVNRAVDRMAQAIARHVHRQNCENGCKRRCVTQGTQSEDRRVAAIDDAIDRAVALRWIVIDGLDFTPGKAQPT